jgi:FixJ family two-component response regulator
VAASCGFEPRILQNHERFEDVVAAWQPGIIILDIIMPDRDGLELIQALFKLEFNGQLILVSGAQELYLTMATTTARDCGLAVSASLRKPCRADDLREEIRLAAARHGLPANRGAAH